MVLPFRFQFTLATLMLLMALAGFAARWYSLHRKVVAAQLECDRAHAIYRDGGEFETIGRRVDAWYCRASLKLCEAQCALPFSDEGQNHRAHLERMLAAEEHSEALAQIGLFGDPNGPREMVRTIRNHRIAAERWLEHHGK